MKTITIRKNERGIALLITLSILAIVLILLIAFVTSMRTERIAAKNFSDSAKAKLLAEGAVEKAVATISAGTPLQTNAPTSLSSTPVSFWTAPGFALSFFNNTWTRTLLYSTNNPAPANTNDWVNLNDKQQITGTNSLTVPAPSPNDHSGIYAGWSNVGANGTEAGAGNPIVGRFAFWVDDEATKVDVNTAWKRDISGGGSTSTNNSLLEEIDLRALEPPFSDNMLVADAVSISTHGANPPFNTVEEIKTVSPAIGNPQDAYSANRFFITAFTGETNIDTWGRGRIDLNSLSLADVSAASPAYNRLSDDIYKNIYTLSSTRDTFVKKYGSDNILQILANIIDYRRPAAANATHDARNTLEIPQTFCGLKKGPFLNEIIFHAMQTNAISSVVTNPGPVLITNWNVFVRVFADVEVVNPFPVELGKDYEVVVEPASISYQIFAGQLGAPHRANVGPVFTNWYPIAVGLPGLAITMPLAIPASVSRVFPTNILAYSYRTLSMTNYMGKAVTPPAENWQYVPAWSNTTTFAGGGTLANEAPGVTNVVIQLKRVVLRKTAGTALSVRDWATSLGPGGRTDLPASIIPAALLWDLKPSTDTPLRNWLEAVSGQDYDTNAVGFAKNDPRMRTFQSVPIPSTVTNWAPTFMSAGGGFKATPTAGTAGSIFEHKTQAFVPGLLPDGSEREAIENPEDCVASTFYIKEGNFESPGELGFIHTGVPWKTLRMQSIVPPANSVKANTIANPLVPLAEVDAIPDWVLLDIFTAGTTPVVRGRLNINSSFFGSNTFDRTLLPPRTVSMAALFYGMGNTPLSYPITNNLTPSTPFAVNFWWGTNVNPVGFSPSGVLPQPSSMIVTQDIVAGNIALAHDTNLTQIARNAYFVTNSAAAPGYGYNTNALFLTPGEVCEVKGIDNALVGWGSPLQGPRKADKELIMRKIANLITTRSNVFTVWAIGQTIIDVNKNGTYEPGTDVLSGEVRVQAIVARDVDTSVSPSVVKFRTLYYRYIYE
jgi:Tfp pilus assembly protein PilX